MRGILDVKAKKKGKLQNEILDLKATLMSKLCKLITANTSN